jgi:hypothetical protein
MTLFANVRSGSDAMTVLYLFFLRFFGPACLIGAFWRRQG